MEKKTRDIHDGVGGVVVVDMELYCGRGIVDG